ncbi:uncharacterized protein LOC131080005 [Cryptomeria japonica]|uniref:uncharacterized protein LOC131080005 n=1 Tax=Cryptomeria japonica TaxID=3369 RepID=UPI0027D9CF5B|nr:uncharacterized protein LOC131080005 [Cryptomeria japonica]
MSTSGRHGGRRSSGKQFSEGEISSEEDRKQKISGDEKHVTDRRNTPIDGDNANVRVYHEEHSNERDHGKRHRTDSVKSHADRRDRGKDRTREHEGNHGRRRSLSGNKRDRKAVEVNISGFVSASAQNENGEGVVRGTEKGVGRSGGAYIPPFKLAQMMKDVQDKSSVEYQRMTWDALRKSINGLVNKVNASNIKNIIPELFAENLIRGRGLFCRSLMKSQMASPGFTDVFAALIAVVNTKFPEVDNLLLRRIILQLKRAYKRNAKHTLIVAAKFIAHLVNQQVAHEIIALELLTLLLENPTDDSVEVAVGFVKECGSLLQDLSPKGLYGIFERFRGILHEGEIDKRVQFLIEGLFAIRKAKFEGHPAVRAELDLVEQEDQLTHEVFLEDELDQEAGLDVFKPDPEFLEHETAYEKLKKDILGDASLDEPEGENDSGDQSDDDDDDDEEEVEEALRIQDETETNLVNLRRTIYLTIMSSFDFEEAGHKLLKIKLEPGQEMELCIMLLECCSQERTYLRYYGLLGQRFCMINKIYQEFFDKCFVQQYSMIHRLETNKLRNVAKFFAHLLGTDALPWHCLAYIRLTEEDTTSSSRILIKILFQELAEQLGIVLLNERLNDPTMQESYDSIFPKDNPKNSRFAINFFTSIGLGGITESLREHLKNMPRLIMQQQKSIPESDESISNDDSSSSSGSLDSDTSESDSESETDSERRKEQTRKKNISKHNTEYEKTRIKKRARTSDSENENESNSDSDINKRKTKRK